MDRARWRGTLTRRVLPRLAVGVEFNLAEEEVGPLATVFLVKETHHRPSLFLGTSSDRIGSPRGTTAFYLTAAKRIPQLPVSTYASLNWSEWDDGFNVPFGATVFLGESFAVQPMYDGHRAHLTASWRRRAWTVTGLWIWLEQIGVAVSAGWGGGS